MENINTNENFILDVNILTFPQLSDRYLEKKTHTLCVLLLLNVVNFFILFSFHLHISFVKCRETFSVQVLTLTENGEDGDEITNSMRYKNTQIGEYCPIVISFIFFLIALCLLTRTNCPYALFCSSSDG